MTDYSTLMPGDAIVALRTLPRRVNAALGSVDEVTEGRAHQLGSDGVSAVEAILGASATLAVLEKGLSDVSIRDDACARPIVAFDGIGQVGKGRHAFGELFQDRLSRFARRELNGAKSPVGHCRVKWGVVEN